MSEFWIGADPGGNYNSFGLAFLEPSGALHCVSVSSVDEAVERIVGESTPLGLAIDALMYYFWPESP